MDLNELIQMGARAFRDSQGSGDAGSKLDLVAIGSALSGLIGDGGDINIASIISSVQGGGLGDLVQSWLGDGQNQGISGSQLGDMLGSDKISEFASKLGISEGEAIGGLQDAVPQIVDKASSGGSILDSIGGVEGAMNLAGKLFGK